MCHSPSESLSTCPEDCALPNEYDFDPVFVVPNDCGPKCCEGTINAVVFSNNYFELYVNGKFVKGDPVSEDPSQSVSFTFTANSSEPIEYAVYLEDYMEDSTGLEYDHSALGSGGFIAKFSDGTTTSSDWKCQVVNSGPNPESCCYDWQGGLECKGNGTCVTTSVPYDSNWFTTGYDFSSWPNAVEYSDHQTGWGVPPVYNPLTAECFSAWLNVSKYENATYTTPEECQNPVFDNVSGSFKGSKFIWGPDLIQDNVLLCRYTNPGPSKKSFDASENCPICTAPYATSQRVRKEVRNLTSDEWQKVVNAYWTMKNTPQDVGEALYGKYYRQYDYFPSKHAVTTTDLRGDQGHFSAAFITWHSTFLLEFENSLRAIDPSIEALPYWDSTITEPSIFTDQYFGSVPGTGDYGMVIDGQFAYWPVVANWTLEPYYPYINNFTTIGFQNSATGYLRSEDDTNPNPYVTRFGKEFVYTEEDFNTCRSIAGYWMDWYGCIELGAVRGKRVTKNNISHHSGAHLVIGDTASPALPGQEFDGGDFMDVVTSPNEPLFMFHHANMDRSKMWYMLRNENKANICWGFPVKNARTIPLLKEYPGINLNDEMASAWGFTAESLGLSNIPHSGLLTHADAMCQFSPFTSPYIYDDMVGVSYHTGRD